ncbi:DUF397 domain-containing protein [Catellatospora sp. NPDC049609]|uniref:DUF397 domain-containing protein n=1 Tax=Catellatospora sp. NPDC049609 TaxID=3155505 RepID=UPI00341D84D0
MGTPDFTSAAWRKSIHSEDGGCVEIATVEGHIGVRDSKAKGAGPILVFDQREWIAFVAGITDGSLRA